MIPPSVRASVLGWPPLSACRVKAALTLSPVLRRGIARADHGGRFAWARWVIPGSTAQIREELVPFGEFVAARNPVRICEIGTQHGGTSLFFCGIAPTLRTFIGIDLRPANTELVSALSPAAVDIAFLRGSSRDATVRNDLASLLGDGLLDLLFIDGDHNYDGVCADLHDYRALVRPGGLIAFHDIRPVAGGTQVNPLAWSGGVHRFWHEIRAKFPYWEFVRDPTQDGYGIGVIEYHPAVSL